MLVKNYKQKKCAKVRVKRGVKREEKKEKKLRLKKGDKASKVETIMSSKLYKM